MASPLPGTPLTWSPHGASDTLDASSSFPGAMASLQNLIPDPSTTDLWQCRPAAVSLTSFAGFTTPTFVSARLVVGNIVYGMVSTGRFTGRDEPFAYNLTSNTFTTITGVTAGNTPLSPSPSQTSAWTPPSMALVGSQIIVTHPGFIVSNGYFGVINISTSTAPTWTSQNTTNSAVPVATFYALPSPPVWVSNFNQRAYFLVNPTGIQPAAYVSDVLLPTVCTGSGNNFVPIFTFDDNVALTCAAGLALTNQLGGIIQSLMVFKGVENIYQITGDPFIPAFAGGSSATGATSTLTINTLNVATGTLAPNSVANTEKGIVFVAPDGVRLIDFTAKVSDPIGKAGTGITQPFFNAGTPSRICGAYNSGVYRVQVQNTNVAGSPSQQWWYDFVRDVWSGPHTQPMALVAPYLNTFIVTLQGVAAIWQSDQIQSGSSSFIENGVQLTYNFEPSMLPDTDQMAEVSMVETTVYMALNTFAVTATALDQNGAVLDTVNVFSPGAGSIWGHFNWGQANWGGSGAGNLYPRQLAWHYPLVFRRLQISVTGNSFSGIKLGRMHLRYQVLNYLQM